MNKKFYDKRTGFTLIEILIVLLVIGILIAVILASLSKAKDKAADARVKHTLSEIALKAEQQEIALE